MAGILRTFFFLRGPKDNRLVFLPRLYRYSSNNTLRCLKQWHQVCELLAEPLNRHLCLTHSWMWINPTTALCPHHENELRRSQPSRLNLSFEIISCSPSLCVKCKLLTRLCLLIFLFVRSSQTEQWGRCLRVDSFGASMALPSAARRAYSCTT